MSIEDAIRIDAEIIAILGPQLFRAKLSNGHLLHAHAARRDASLAVALQVGKTVRLEMSPYDMSEARIQFPARPKI